MKTTTFLLGVSLLIWSNTFSQENNIELKKFGVGASHAFDYMEYWNIDYPMDLNKVLFTINVNNKFRIEPEVSGGYNRAYEEFWIYTGSGFFFQKQMNKLNTLYGFRTGVSFNDYSGLIVHAAPAFGMEYFLSNQFSFGLEIQLKTGINLFDSDEINVAILAPISVRFYLR